MKVYIFYLLIFSAVLHSQSWQDSIKDPANYYSIKKAYLNNISNPKEAKIESRSDEDADIQFRRWEYFMEPRVYPTGNYPSPRILLEQLAKMKVQYSDIIDTLKDANWKSLDNPNGFPNSGYSGRLNCIAFHPTDTNIIYVGSPSGGLWRTTNGGKTWITTTDNIPTLGISEIVIDPKNPDIMYLATGDKDAAWFISNPYSYGILKSIDGGRSWFETGLKHIFEDQMTIQRLLIHPVSTNVLIAAVTGVNGNNRGIWRSSDGGENWKNVSGGGKFDIEFHPANPNIVYGAGYKYLIKSTDAGQTWNIINSEVLPVNEVTYARISVTPANPKAVFVQYLKASDGSTYGLYKSNDEGVTWSQINQTSIPTQSAYDWVLTVSPKDENLIFVGVQDLHVSTDGGKTKTYYPSGHVDHHAMEYRPGSNTLYDCNDGGLYKSTNDGLSWINLNKGLQTFQYYRMGNSALNPGMILTGAQDNGSMKMSLPKWMLIGGGDGMESIVDYTDTTIYYWASQYGNMVRSVNSDGYFSAPPNAGNPSYCGWVTPYIIHPQDPKILYYGGKEIYKTTDRGNSWTNYSTNLTTQDNVGGGMLRTMSISNSDPDNVLYAASYVVVYKTTDGGKSWHNVTSNLPVNAGCFTCTAISSIAVHPENPDIVWVTMAGYSKSNRIFKTTDGGKSWTNVSGNLPVIPVNCIVVEKNSKEAVYIGTDLGVFYKDSTMQDWIPFQTGLPYTPVMELEIQYASSKLRAATFGRGLWESSLYGTLTEVKESNSKDVAVTPNPAREYINYSNPNSDKIEVYSIYGQRIELKIDEYASKIDISDLAPGMYIIKIGAKVQRFIKI